MAYETKTLNGRHVFLGLVLFFGVMIVANGFLVYYAVSTFSGGDRPNPYRSGLNYNQTIADGKRQAALGWSAVAQYDAAAAALTIEVKDRNGEPLSGLVVSGSMNRPTTNQDDRIITFSENEAGIYGTEVSLPPGNWVLSAAASARKGGKPLHRLKQRLFVKSVPVKSAQ